MQAELKTPVAVPIRKIDITEQPFYRRKKPYQGMENDQVHELKQLQEKTRA